MACSGGADSSALLLALAAATDDLVVGHVVHDLRPRKQALGDRDAVRALADKLGLPCMTTEVAVLRRGNTEAEARRSRYAALVEMARRSGCSIIATGHHAEDHLETMLMALLRGAGPKGLSGVPKQRKLTTEPPHVMVVRPMLGDRYGRVNAVSRAEAQDLCRAAGWIWREDATNGEESLLRNAIRRRVLPVLEELRPGAAVRAARSGDALRAAARNMQSRARRVCDKATLGQSGKGRTMGWSRDTLRQVEPALLGEVMRIACRRLQPKGVGLDRLSRRALAPVIRAIRDDSTDPRKLAAGPLRVSVTARAVTVGIGVPSDHDLLDHSAHSRRQHQHP